MRHPDDFAEGLHLRETVSYSEWETEADIERYTNSAAHKQIVSHTRSVKGASAVVKLYDLVN